MLKAGIPPWKVQRVLRHSDVKVTLGRYAHMLIEDYRDAVAALPPASESAEHGAHVATVWQNSPDTQKEAVTWNEEGPGCPGPALEREKGFERFRRWVNYSWHDAPLPFIASEPFAFPVPSRSTSSRPVPALGAAAGHMWGT